MNSNAGNGDRELAALLAAGRVRKTICSLPRQADSYELRTLLVENVRSYPDRLVAFADAVVAISLTLLILPLVAVAD